MQSCSECGEHHAVAVVKKKGEGGRESEKMRDAAAVAVVAKSDAIFE